MSKELFGQWTQNTKDLFKPMLELGSIFQEYNKKLVMQASGAAFEQINTVVKHVQNVAACRKAEDVIEQSTKTLNTLVENNLNLGQSSLEAVYDQANKCSKWAEEQFSAIGQKVEEATGKGGKGKA